MRKVWIAWEDDTSIRSRVLADELGADYFAFTRFDGAKRFGWLRYPVAALQTAWTLISKRPNLVVVQSPSILLAVEAAVLRPLLRYCLAIDLHTPFGRPNGFVGTIVDRLHRYGLRHCDMVIVTNEPLRGRVQTQTDAAVLVLPDKVPQIQGTDRRGDPGTRFDVLYICTYSADEPWRDVIAAAALLPRDVCIHISGRSHLRPEDVPANVVLTGYLPRKDYQDLLCSVHGVMVLTTVRDNLVCGGYEAVAVGKPLVLSDTQALRHLFHTGTVFTRNEPAAIAAAVLELRGQNDVLTSDIARLKDAMNASWSHQWAALIARVGARQDGSSEGAVSNTRRDPIASVTL